MDAAKFDDVLRLGDDLPRLSDDLSPRRGDLNLFIGTFKQRNAQALFQLAHLRAKRRLSDATRLGGPAKVPVVGQGDEVAELRGEQVFFGKGRCSTCHAAPYYTDNLMHNLRAERFYKPRDINGRMASVDGPIKTFPLRGIKDSPPYLHDGRLLTLEDTVEFFNLVLGTRLTESEKRDLVMFMYSL